MLSNGGLIESHASYAGLTMRFMTLMPFEDFMLSLFATVVQNNKQEVEVKSFNLLCGEEILDYD